ncbi:hypothetical protein RN001_001365 [Aquatica leii]|uniref:Uncharacterized protein n=1 Tax=Aquatica leii TaxID=1421715 RepID=A0AAN7Q3Y7_9COLE|nr:hypothetical protein RN001_001365 [Aquatica leii]
MEFKSKLSGPAVSSQSREIIANVYAFMTQEAEAGDATIPLRLVKQRVAAAVGISERSIQRIMNEKQKISAGECSKFLSPRKTISKQKKKQNIEYFEKGVLKRIIHNMHVTDGTVPTIAKILTKFRDAVGYIPILFHKMRGNHAINDEKQLSLGENACISGHIKSMKFNGDIQPAYLKGDVQASMKKIYKVEANRNAFSWEGTYYTTLLHKGILYSSSLINNLEFLVKFFSYLRLY